MSFIHSPDVSGPPSAPVSALSSVNGTSVYLEWIRPANSGGRFDIRYNVLCRKCAWKSSQCEACGNRIRFSPKQMGLTEPAINIVNLLAHTNYTLQVEAVNGVSDLSFEPRQFISLNVTTNQAGMKDKFHATLSQGMFGVVYWTH